MQAMIQNAKLVLINEIWKKHKPQGLGFSDNDAIIINLKTESNDTFSQTFYCRLKADGTLGHSSTSASEKRQQELRNFIKKYISQKEDYNIRFNINKWKGKKVDIDKIDGSYIIKI